MYTEAVPAFSLILIAIFINFHDGLAQGPPPPFISPIPGIGPDQIFGQPGVIPPPPTEPPGPTLLGFPQLPPPPLVNPFIVTPTTIPPLPPGYVCVPVGTCNPAGNNGIDIRIVTPVSTY